VGNTLLSKQFVLQKFYATPPNMQIDQNQIRKQIRKDLAAHIEKNPRYSLRAYASKMGISPSFLSRFLNGKKNLSLEQTLRLGRELGLDLIFDETAERDRKESGTAFILNENIFHFIADWYHLPLLELIQTKGFKNDVKWMAARLKLAVPTIQAALDRLEDLGFISRENGNIKIEKNVFLKTPDDIANVAQRKHHQQMMEKAKEALHTQPVHEREYQALNLNFNKSDLTKAKKYIRQFCEEFNKEFARKRGEQVYQLNIQFFNLTEEDI
jgi:transcriptional regulator with XRE-family HTH domain